MAKLAALLIGAAVLLVGALLAAKIAPGEALSTLIHGSLATPNAIAGTLRETTPLLLAGLAVFFALRGGLFNIGVEGQLLVGALASAVVALKFGGFLGITAGLLAGAVAGMLWALPAGLIKAYRNGHEVITTIMLNSVALLLTDYLVTGPFRAPGQTEPTTSSLPVGSMFPPFQVGEIPVGLGLLFGVILVIATHFWFRQAVAGYELRAVGANATAAVYAGMDARRKSVMAMAVSGSIAGFAGAVQVLGFEGRFYSGFSPGYGFDALGVALLAGNGAIGLLPSSLLFGVLAKGGTALQIDGVPKGITTVLLGLLIVSAAAIRYREVKKVA